MKRMKLSHLFTVVVVTDLLSVGFAQPRTTVLKLSFGSDLGPLEIGRFALGQGGLSPDPIWDSRVAEVRALRASIIQLIVQEYFNLLLERGHYHFDTLDQSVNEIVLADAQPPHEH
jgi:hypothetical protein